MRSCTSKRKFDKSWLKSVVFLGHVISKSEVAVDLKEIEAIIDWLGPNNGGRV